MFRLVFPTKRFTEECSRIEMANKIACAIALQASEAYPTNFGGDTYAWTVDKLNNSYWLFFDEDKPNQLVLRCRYDYQRPTLQHLSNYLAAKFSAEVVEMR